MDQKTIISHEDQTKAWRADLTATVDSMLTMQRDQQSRNSRERALAVTKVQEAIMWLEQDLKAIAAGK
jgi:hypothetical protein